MISCATGASIPDEVEASKAVYHSLPERAEPCNVTPPTLRILCAGMMLLRRKKRRREVLMKVTDVRAVIRHRFHPPFGTSTGCRITARPIAGSIPPGSSRAAIDFSVALC